MYLMIIEAMDQKEAGKLKAHLKVRPSAAEVRPKPAVRIWNLVDGGPVDHVVGDRRRTRNEQKGLMLELFIAFDAPHGVIARLAASDLDPDTVDAPIAFVQQGEVVIKPIPTWYSGRPNWPLAEFECRNHQLIGLCAPAAALPEKTTNQQRQHIMNVRCGSPHLSLLEIMGYMMHQRHEQARHRTAVSMALHLVGGRTWLKANLQAAAAGLTNNVAKLGRKRRKFPSLPGVMPFGHIILPVRAAGPVALTGCIRDAVHQRRIRRSQILLEGISEAVSSPPHSLTNCEAIRTAGSLTSASHKDIVPRTASNGKEISDRDGVTADCATIWNTVKLSRTRGGGHA
jgi:hypothetical protein